MVFGSWSCSCCDLDFHCLDQLCCEADSASHAELIQVLPHAILKRHRKLCRVEAHWLLCAASQTIGAVKLSALMSCNYAETVGTDSWHNGIETVGTVAQRQLAQRQLAQLAQCLDVV